MKAASACLLRRYVQRPISGSIGEVTRIDFLQGSPASIFLFVMELDAICRVQTKRGLQSRGHGCYQAAIGTVGGVNIFWYESGIVGGGLQGSPIALGGPPAPTGRFSLSTAGKAGDDWGQITSPCWPGPAWTDSNGGAV